jgi:signal recognition particle subunit SRP54
VLRQWWNQLRAFLALFELDEFTLDDFMSQMGQVKKLGPVARVIRIAPGMSELTKKMGLSEIDVQFQMKRMFAIYLSMTKGERRDIDLLNGSRRRRIADGSGMRTSDVAQFARQFRMCRDMMRGVRGW